MEENSKWPTHLTTSSFPAALLFTPCQVTTGKDPLPSLTRFNLILERSRLTQEIRVLTMSKGIFNQRVDLKVANRFSPCGLTFTSKNRPTNKCRKLFQRSKTTFTSSWYFMFFGTPCIMYIGYKELNYFFYLLNSSSELRVRYL